MGAGNVCTFGPCEGLYYVDNDFLDIYSRLNSDGYYDVRLQKDVDDYDSWSYDETESYFNRDMIVHAFACEMMARFPSFEYVDKWISRSRKAILENKLFYRAFFTLAIFGGFRRGELLGLEWSDIDFDEYTISVKRTSLYTKEKGIFTSTTKTKSSERTLKLPEQLFQLLHNYQKEQARQRLVVGDRWNNTNRLFTQLDGSPMGPDTVRHWLKKFCEDEGLRYVSVHSFRHLCASLLISNGTDARTVSATLGHAQTTTTMNIYAHSFAEVQARASEALASTLIIDSQKSGKKAKNA